MKKHIIILWLCEILCEIICIGFLVYYFISGTMFWIPLYIFFTVLIVLAKKIQPDLKNNFFIKIPAVFIYIYIVLFIIVLWMVKSTPVWVAPVTLLLAVPWKKFIKKIHYTIRKRFDKQYGD